jgi:hypothetical protein
MNSTSQNPGRKFPFTSGHNAMDNTTLYVTLAATAGFGLLFILAIYAWVFGGNPLRRLDYGIFMSIVPAVGVVAVIKLTRLLVSRLGAVAIYTVLFILVLLLQAVGRLFPVYS